jgi:hypothetical protein
MPNNAGRPMSPPKRPASTPSLPATRRSSSSSLPAWSATGPPPG